MALTLRRRQWLGARIAVGLQTALFFPLDHFFGHWISALVIGLTNVALAAAYRSPNPYLVGARWATFWNMGLLSLARHTYWYAIMLSSFIRLRDFNRPLGANELLCRGSLEAVIITVTTSAVVLLFYSFTPRWPEWTGRWEMLRRAPFSASLGFQAVIVTAVVYPTPLTLTCALYFSSIISPIVRRQVRLNHVVFLMMVPLFALGSPPLALFWSLVCGLTFLYFLAMERTLPVNGASFTFFNGVAFLALFFATIESRAKLDAYPWVGKLVLATLFLLMGTSYLLVLRGDAVVGALRTWAHRLTPALLRESSWWSIRDLWVDREYHTRVEKLYQWKTVDKSVGLGLFFFGPREWPAGSETYTRVEPVRLNLTPSILVLTIYSLFQGVDAVLFLTPGGQAATVGGFLLAFAFILGSPLLLLLRQRKERHFFRLPSVLASCFTMVVLLTYMAAILYFGLTSTESLAETAKNVTSSAPTAPAAGGVSPDDCPCGPHRALGFPGK